MQNPDDYGFYSIGNLKTYSKLEMMTSWGKHPQAFHWNFNDAVFSSYDWSVEPLEDIDELYRIRAEQLRSDYDKVVIVLGGIDSTNILHTFLANGIKVDEVVTFWSKFDEGGVEYQELHNYNLPKLKIWEEKYNTKIPLRVIDHSVNLHMAADYIKKDHLFVQNSMVTVNEYLKFNTMCQEYDRSSPEWKNHVNAGKSTCLIYGIDKPSVYFRDGKWVFNINDVQTGQFGNIVRSQMTKDPVYTEEWFYWSPKAVKIIIKQCHLIKKLFYS
jgi:hypothetical protein